MNQPPFMAGEPNLVLLQNPLLPVPRIIFLIITEIPEKENLFKTEICTEAGIQLLEHPQGVNSNRIHRLWIFHTASSIPGSSVRLCSCSAAGRS